MMRKNMITTIFVLMLLISCSSIQVDSQNTLDQFIARSHSNQIIKLSLGEFDRWLLHKKQLLLNNKKQQIESYFVEEYLYRNKDLIDHELQSNIYFLNKAVMYSKAVNTVKKQIMEKVKVDEKEIQQNIIMLQQRAKLKTHKVRLYQIYKKYPINASLEEKQLLKKQMQLIRDNITDLNGFKKAASRESDSQTRLFYGLLGNVKNGKFKGEINNIVMKMQANEISEVITGTHGVLMFYCEKRIAPKIKTLQQTTNYVIQTLRNRNFSNDFNKHFEDTLNKQRIQIDWEKIYEDSPSKTAVFSKTYNLTNLELSQLLTNKDRNVIPKKSIESIINNYIANRALFHELNSDQQKHLSLKSHYKLKQSIASSVLVNMIAKKLKIPTDDDLKKHYQENKETYKTKLQYDVSAIAFKLTDDNKASVYNQAEIVLNQLKLKLLSFENASQKHSFLNEKYNNGYLGKFSLNQVPRAIGINAKKQISLMRVGEISKLVETDSSILWIFKLNTIDLPRIQSYIEVKKRIDNQLGNERTDILESEIFTDIITKLNIKLQ